MKTFILIAALVGLASCAPKVNLKDEVPIQDCGSKVEIMSIFFDGCTEFPCIVHQGTTATGQLTMKANAATETLTCKIVGIILGGIELPFNGCPVNACDYLSTGDCAVEEGELLVYDMSIPILDVYPKLEITGKWMLKDDQGEDFLCFTIPMKIE
eukprot:TRINITY_DN6170_c0_g1_i2.p2 TRINITY_DN6170_c0_g1~~TRINITY_DN6170_c0_g1_i2.p2  ORF type:complete len:155 (-),score=46.50 TRINITY_DN6170_c0_g1_i2:48-512(-)